MSVTNGATKRTSSFEEPRGYYCTICYHGYKKDGAGVPRNLTCGHTFCTECLKRLAGQATSFGHVKCPACKVDTVINARGSFPSNDVRKLPKNFGLLEILEGMEDTMQGRGVVAGAAIVDAMMENPQLVCEEHEKETKKVYCLTDKEIICIYCQVYGKHQGHNCQLIGKVAEEGREVLGNYIEMLSKQRDHMNEARKVITDATFAVRCREEKIMRELTRHFEMLRKKLYKRESQLKTQIKNKTNAKIEVLEKQQRMMSDIIVKCERLRALCQISQSSADYDVVSSKDKMEAKISKILEDVSRCNVEAEAQDDVFCHLDSTIAETILQYGMVGEDKGRAEMSQQTGGSSDSTEMTSGSNTTTPETSSTEESADDHTLTGRGTAHKTLTRSQIRSEQPHSAVAREEHPEVSIIFENGIQHQAAYSAPEMDGAVDGQGASARDICESQNSVSAVNQTVVSDNMDLESSNSSAFLVVRGKSHCTGDNNSQTEMTSEGSSGMAAQRLNPTEMNAASTNAAKSFQDFLRFDSPMLLCSSSDDSSDLSCLSDLEVDMEISLRSQQSHSGLDMVDGDVDFDRDGNDEFGTAGCVSVRRRTASSSAAVNTSSSLPDPWEVNPQAHSPNSLNGSPSRCSLENENITCSVLNCSNSAKAWLKCRNCSRAFCFACAKTTVSARRCYKRPRGHSFVRICEGPTKDEQLSSPGGAKAISSGHAYSLRSRLHTAPMVLRCENTAEKTWKCSRCGYFNMITANKKSDFCSKCRSQRTL
ncbi:uncharacterized protein [Ptychodera flava]|uniref:uncharacterized protein isoform X2 n=1 Tax=Ptychodera flava TaxID=63121 RepID=UPI00396A1C69